MAVSASIKPEQVESITESLAVYGPIVVIFFVVMTHVVAPLTGPPVVVAGVRLYGYAQMSVYLYIVGLISAYDGEDERGC